MGKLAPHSAHVTLVLPDSRASKDSAQKLGVMAFYDLIRLKLGSKDLRKCYLGLLGKRRHMEALFVRMDESSGKIVVCVLLSFHPGFVILSLCRNYGLQFKTRSKQDVLQSPYYTMRKGC
jgi:hypothetical protein